MEFIKKNIKNIIIVILSILFLIACITIYVLANKDNLSNELKTISGTVIIADKSYVIIETDIDDYLVKDIKGNYIVGDTIKIKYYSKDLNYDDSLKTIKFINDEELIKREIANEEINNENINNNNSNNNSNSNQNINNNINSNNTTNSDTEVLNYFNELNNDFDSTSIKDSLKNGFITVVDFLFYEGKIKGYTFNELSDSAKLKVLSMALYFDSKIEKYFPGYKESISTSTNKIYTTVKEEIISNYMELTTIICTKDEELCIKAKESFDNIKEKFGLTWSLIKDIAGDGISNLKNWYEIWSGK